MLSTCTGAPLFRPNAPTRRPHRSSVSRPCLMSSRRWATQRTRPPSATCCRHASVAVIVLPPPVGITMSTLRRPLPRCARASRRASRWYSRRLTGLDSSAFFFGPLTSASPAWSETGRRVPRGARRRSPGVGPLRICGTFREGPPSCQRPRGARPEASAHEGSRLRLPQPLAGRRLQCRERTKQRRPVLVLGPLAVIVLVAERA